MSADWKRFSREAALRIEGNALLIACGGDRMQRVFVEVTDAETLRLWSVVVRRRDVPPDAAIASWKINRYRELVGFRVAEHGRVIGESWIPATGLTADEWKLYVETLAHACDRLEYQWTGKDFE